MQRQSWTDRVERLRAELVQNDDPAALALAMELAACGVDWGGRYRCRCPACGRCRRTYIRSQQRAALAWAEGLSNADLGFVSIVAAGTDDLAALGDITAAISRGARNRIDAERRVDPDRWGRVRMLGWAEIDALAGDHLPLLGSGRRTLLPQIAPVSIGSTAPTWIATCHAIVDVGGTSLAEINDALARQWPIAGQVDVQPFDMSRPVENNVSYLAGYANKHSCSITLGAMKEPWPMTWQAAIFAKLSEKRNAFEFFRFGIGPSIVAQDGTETSSPDVFEDDALPFAYSSITFPMYNITGR